MASRQAIVAATLTALAVAGVGVYGVGLLVGGGSHDSSAHPGSVHLPSPHRSHGSTASTGPGSQEPRIRSQDAYYLGNGPHGPVLFGQKVFVFPGMPRLETAVDGLMERPDLPQYRTVWQPGWFIDATQAAGVLRIDAAGAPTGRPAGMDDATATQSIQQVVYTLQSAARSHQPVQFLRGGKPAATVLGVDTHRPVPAAPVTQARSRMNVTGPDIDGSDLSRGPTLVTGLSNTENGTVDVRLEQHGAVVREARGRASGYGGPDRLYPWKVRVDTTGLSAGTYRIIASGPDPADPGLVDTDSRPFHLGRHHG
jgi:hypothetical protein